MFSFYPKNSRTGSKNSHYSEVVGCRKLLNHSLSNVFNLLLIGLRYALSFEWPDFGPKYLVTVIPKGQPPKFKTSV